MPISGGLLVAVLALAFAGHSSQANTGVVGHPDTDTDRPNTTSRAPASPSPSAAMYLPTLPMPEPADPCKAGNYDVASAVCAYYTVYSRYFFVSFFVSLSATLRENGWTDLHEIFREGVE